MAPTKQLRISDNGKEPRRFTCASCNKSFKRSEHCARHELMHTQERPFPCRKCGKRYGRKDLLRRHERTIHAEQYVNNAGHDMPENSPSSDVSENSDPCDPPNMEDCDREAPALHNKLSSVPQPLGQDPLPQETQNSDVPSMPGEVESTLQAAPLMYHANGLSLPSSSSICHYGLQFPSLSPFGGHDTQMGSDPLFMHLLLGGTPNATRYTGIDDTNGIISTTNGEREIPPTSTSPQDVNPTIAGANPSAEHSIGAACGTTLGADFLDGLVSLDFQADLGTSPSDTWSRDPSNLTRSLPTIRQEKSVQSPRYLFNETVFEKIHSDASVELGNPDPDYNFFKLNELQQFIKSYIECFHVHLPFIHLPSFSPPDTPSPLILAMASIGALYRLRRRPLLVDDREVLSRAVKTYVNAPLERNDFVTKAARKAYEGFKGPVTIGVTLVSKTAAFSWGIEHAVAGWDSGESCRLSLPIALLLTKWVYSMEVDVAGQQPSNEELQLVDDLRSLLAEVQYEHERNIEGNSLAALLARAWAALLGDVC
ncbi:hypothetical protein N7472_005224 [Penicillium cf. griseofulvum]|uniref:C2H2-type domain-containing protein n=1 Tax=Penicillium cf. griseofulvum TaxID=2972120 RepID=A0A9W9MEZ2_9EURO|nr:hypothetical protein N7472_005224 [Penicillium cf. griseofulvum]